MNHLAGRTRREAKNANGTRRGRNGPKDDAETSGRPDLLRHERLRGCGQSAQASAAATHKQVLPKILAMHGMQPGSV